MTDPYTKLGDSSFNGGAAVLICDYSAGYNCLIASSNENRTTIQKSVLDAVIREWLTALEAQAAAGKSQLCRHIHPSSHEPGSQI